MIEIGNTVISNIFVGQNTPSRVDVGGTQVWPDGSSYYITLDPATVLIMYGQQSGGTINVNTNAPNWNVEVSPANSYISASKQNGNIVWSIQANTGTTSRNAYITASYGAASAQTTIYQNNGYAIYIEGGNNPRVVSSGGTSSLVISVISKYGNDAVAVSSASTQSWVQCTNMTVVGGGKYVFTFNVDRSTDSQTRHCTLTFTQQQGSGGTYKNTSIMITQQAMYVPTQISGFTMYAQSGEWMLGRFKISEQEMGQYGVQPIYAAAILRATVPPYDYTAEYDFTSYYGVPGPTQQVHPASTVSRTVSQDTANPVSIPNGGTGYGWIITSYPNLQPFSNITFNVSRTT